MDAIEYVADCLTVVRAPPSASPAAVHPDTALTAGRPRQQVHLVLPLLVPVRRLPDHRTYIDFAAHSTPTSLWCSSGNVGARPLTRPSPLASRPRLSRRPLAPVVVVVVVVLVESRPQSPPSRLRPPVSTLLAAGTPRACCFQIACSQCARVQGVIAKGSVCVAERLRTRERARRVPAYGCVRGGGIGCTPYTWDGERRRRCHRGTRPCPNAVLGCERAQAGSASAGVNGSSGQGVAGGGGCGRRRWAPAPPPLVARTAGMDVRVGGLVSTSRLGGALTGKQAWYGGGGYRYGDVSMVGRMHRRGWPAPPLSILGHFLGSSLFLNDSAAAAPQRFREGTLVWGRLKKLCITSCAAVGKSWEKHFRNDGASLFSVIFA
ncbi:hypothetical protein C8F04DRAFT_190099 [Mycena alexandri]|uniref:Uncharacterized protein n=1 Tax=Mycena alexandri TaxID=1745969 RepID=A0AAD6SD01_9AGAR|nr:hypothetical protein C8F04DRAFT_190099 [Mycena alexandri]